MRYRFTPEHPGALAYAYQGGPLLKAGDVVEMSDVQRDRLISIIPGCLTPDAAAGFIEAVSAPTPANPETMPAAASAKPEPVKRARGTRS